MASLKKTLKKGVKALKNYAKNPIKYSAIAQLVRGAEKNWTDIRTPLMYAGIAVAAAYTGGAALGALGVGAGAAGAGAAGAAAGASAATGAAIAGGVSGAATGIAQREGEKAADRAAAEQERIAEREAAEQQRLSLLSAGQMKSQSTDLGEQSGRRRFSSQYKQTMVSRQNGKKIGGGTSTLG